MNAVTRLCTNVFVCQIKVNQNFEIFISKFDIFLSIIWLIIVLLLRLIMPLDHLYHLVDGIEQSQLNVMIVQLVPHHYNDHRIISRHSIVFNKTLFLVYFLSWSAWSVCVCVCGISFHLLILVNLNISDFVYFVLYSICWFVCLFF